MGKNKTIKTSTLEKRFQKLHDAANYTIDCGYAIEHLLEEFLASNATNGVFAPYRRYQDKLAEWDKLFVKLASAMERVESKYYDHLKNENQECELIEDVPAFGGYTTPPASQVEGKLFEIGYYELEGEEPEPKNFTPQELKNEINSISEMMVFFVKALANADYKGIWQEVGDIAAEIYDNTPNEEIYKVVELL